MDAPDLQTLRAELEEFLDAHDDWRSQSVAAELAPLMWEALATAWRNGYFAGAIASHINPYEVQA